ncbi:MAG: alkaline phosphatase family protein [Candidatus Altiarchaeota archaeon]|nr:alkaline phosphatase family protein [Candidatus Altiarchaeota archaeon]
MEDLAGKNVKLPQFKHNISEISNEVMAAFGQRTGKLVKGEYEKVILLVMDGLGHKNLVDRGLINGLGLKSHELGSVIPSSTPAALASIFTGKPPAEHGIFGFTFFLPEIGRFNPFEFTDSFGDYVDLGSHHILKGETIFQKLKQHKVKSQHLLRYGISNTPFTHRLSEGAEVVPFSAYGHLLEKLKEGITSRGKKFMLAYLETPDNLLHGGGEQYAYQTELSLVLNLIAKLRDEKNADKTLFILTADHGHIPITYKRANIRENWLSAPVAGGDRHMMLNVVPKFRQKIIHTLSKTSYVFEGADFMRSGLMGQSFDEDFMGRIPDLISFAHSKYTPFIGESAGFASCHGGLSYEEMSTFFGTSLLSDFEPELKFLKK